MTNIDNKITNRDIHWLQISWSWFSLLLSMDLHYTTLTCNYTNLNSNKISFEKNTKGNTNFTIINVIGTK